MSICTNCTKCGEYLECWYTESGDYIVVGPCPNGCTNDMKNKYINDDAFLNEKEVEENYWDLNLDKGK